MADDWAVIGCDEFGVTIERQGPDPEALIDHVASWAQQEEDKWPAMGLLYMLIPPDQVEGARALDVLTATPDRCPHGTVETDVVKCRDCIRERARG